MVVKCPQCGTRYRYLPPRGRVEATPLRCKKCGSRFAVSKSDAEEPPSPSPQSLLHGEENPASSRRTALLADEAREFRDQLVTLLEKAGYEVSVTDNGEEALLLAGSHRFDLILLNVYLRKMLGVTVCERIKASPELSEIPLLLIGAFLRSQEDGGRQARFYGAEDFIETSMEPDEIASRIARLRIEKPASPCGTVIPIQTDPGHDRGEIRRLAEIMLSDLQIYQPERFRRAVRDGTFFEAFAEELGRGKRIIHERFGHLPDRMQVLFAAFREILGRPRAGSDSGSSASG